MFTKKEEQEKERDREEESLAQKASCLHVHKEALLPRGYLPLGRLFVTFLRVSCARNGRSLHLRDIGFDLSEGLIADPEVEG